MTRTFKTNLRCGACEEKIRPAFDADPAIESWNDYTRKNGLPLAKYRQF